MPFLEWQPSMSVNVADLDAQHRSFVDLLNALHDTLMEGNFRDVLLAPERTLERLEGYLVEHFRDEEQYMTRIEFPGLAEHRRSHEEFAGQVRELREASARGETVLNSEIVKTMLTWLGDHVIAEDGKYADFAAARRARR